MSAAKSIPLALASAKVNDMNDMVIKYIGSATAIMFVMMLSVCGYLLIDIKTGMQDDIKELRVDMNSKHNELRADMKEIRDAIRNK